MCGIWNDNFFSHETGANAEDVLFGYNLQDHHEMYMLKIYKNLIELEFMDHLVIALPFSMPSYGQNKFDGEEFISKKFPIKIHLCSYYEGKNQDVFKDTKYISDYELKNLYNFHFF